MNEAHAHRKHATRAPSAAHRWMNCPGSIQMADGIEEIPSSFAAEGTAAHILAETCMRGGFPAERFKGFTIDTAATEPLWGATPNGRTAFLVNSEMVDGVQLYLDVAWEIEEQSEEFETEQRLDMTALVPDNFGTGDVIAYRSTPTRRVTIADLKYGKGVAVDVEENEQLLNYALGVALRYHNRGVDEVELVVVQPRAPHRHGPVRRQVLSAVDLYEFAIAIQAAAEKTAVPNAELVTGDHCKFCKAAGICPQLQGTVFALVSTALIDGEIFGMSDPRAVAFKDWKIEQSNINLVKTWIKAREEFGHAEAIRGRMPPGAKLVGKRAFRKWNDEDTAAEALRLVGLDDDSIYETSLRSPAQVEKELPKGQRKIIDDLASATSSGTVLAPLDDPRPAVDPDDARGFDAVTIGERE